MTINHTEKGNMNTKQNHEFVEEWSAEDHETYAGWMKQAESLRNSPDMFDGMMANHMEYRIDLVWEKQILPTNVEEFIAIPN